MALTQTGENQRKIGVNLSKIIGLKDTPEKMKPLNIERQKGGYNAVGYNANGQPCGCGNGDPNGGGGGSGGGGSGGGGSGGGGSGGGGGGGGGDNCQEVALNSRPKDECMYGVNCETKSSVRIYPDEPPIIFCPQPPKPDDDCFAGYVAVLYPYPSATGQNDAQLSSLENIQGAFDSVVQKGVEIAKQQFVENYGSGGNFTETRIDDRERTISSCNHSYTYTEYRIFIVYQISGWDRTGSATASVVLTNSEQSEYYKNGLKNWNKNKPRNYYIKNGKLIDACNKTTVPPTDCIEICDNNGKKYKVCGNGSVTGID